MFTPMHRRRTKTAVRVAILLVKHAYDRHYAIDLSAEASVSKKDIYPLLTRMRDDGWLQEGWEPQPMTLAGQPRPARRYYTVTDAGRVELRTFLGDLAPPLPPRPSPATTAVRESWLGDRVVLMNEKEASAIKALAQAVPLGHDLRLVHVTDSDWPLLVENLAKIGAEARPTNADYADGVRVYAVVSTQEADAPAG